MVKSKKLFIVDDEQNIRNAIRRMMKENLPSIDVIEAEDDEKVLKIAENNKPDLILLDILMPRMNGLQVLKFLKKSKHKETRKIPVIMLTGVRNKEINIQAEKIGAVDYITKPFDEKIFLLKLKKYLK
ncbi:PleD family two-component system response regulator [candidate division KSB1 bacterium]